MKKQHFTQPMQFSQAELEARLDLAKDEYMNGRYRSDIRDWEYPAVEIHSFSTLEDMIDFSMDKAQQGQQRFKGHPLRSGVGYYEVRIYKPAKAIEQGLKALFEQVEADYQAEIAKDVEEKTALLAEQLYQQAQAKKQKELESKEQKERDAAMKDAQQYVQSLLAEQNL